MFDARSNTIAPAAAFYPCLVLVKVILPVTRVEILERKVIGKRYVDLAAISIGISWH
jgi:hypothetical protein